MVGIAEVDMMPLGGDVGTDGGRYSDGGFGEACCMLDIGKGNSVT